MKHLCRLFGERTERYLNRLTQHRKPKAVVVCGLYFPQEYAKGAPASWADLVLSLTLYNRNPKHLQEALKVACRLGTRSVKVKGTRTRHAPLYLALDPAPDSQDFTQRVEPSAWGSGKLASYLGGVLQRTLAA